VIFWLCCSCYPDFESGLDSYEKEFPGSDKDYFNYAFVPSNEAIFSINSKWLSAVVHIRNQLGDVPRTPVLDVIRWRNTVDSVLGLNALSIDFAPLFNHTLITVVDGLSDTYISYGPNNSFITKSLTSLENKRDRMLNQNPNSYPWETMDDSLRGTIVIKSVVNFASVISRLSDNNFPFYVYCDNKFSDGRAKDSGYVGVHCKVLVQNVTHTLQAELQIHFYDVMDGTTDCPKEYTHGIYEKTRSLSLTDTYDTSVINQEGNNAQKLVFLYGLHRIVPDPPQIHDNLTEADSYYYMWGSLFKKTFSSYNYSHYEVFSPKLGIYYPVNCITGEQDSIGLTEAEAKQVEEYLYSEHFIATSEVFAGTVVGAVVFGFFVGGIIVFVYRKYASNVPFFSFD